MGASPAVPILGSNMVNNPAGQPGAMSAPVAVPAGVPGTQAAKPSDAVNPFSMATGTPAVPTAATAAPGVNPGSTVQSNGINWNDGSNTVTGDMKDTYGAGTGVALSQALQGLGTSTSAAVTATNAETNLEANDQYANIQAQEAAGGVTPNSSTAALAAGDFFSHVNQGLQATDANMELAQQNTLIDTLGKTGAAHGPDGSTFDSIMSGITDAGEIAGDIFTGGISGAVSGGLGNLDKLGTSTGGEQVGNFLSGMFA